MLNNAYRVLIRLIQKFRDFKTTHFPGSIKAYIAFERSRTYYKHLFRAYDRIATCKWFTQYIKIIIS
jgi:hypothetical protein